MSTFPPPPDEWVTVGQSQLEVVAEMMRSRLEAEGIEATLRGNKASGAAGVINELNITWNNPLGGVEVRVHKKDETIAKEILARRDESEEADPEIEQDVSESSTPENKILEKSGRPLSGMRLYFQIFCSLLIGLWTFAAVVAWSQNINAALLSGAVTCLLFFLSSLRPGK